MIACEYRAAVGPHLVCLHANVHTPDGTVRPQTCEACIRRLEPCAQPRPLPTVEELAKRKAARGEPIIAAARPLSALRSPLSSVFFAITAFERPAHLERCVASILKFYPGAKIFVADHGNKKATLPGEVQVIQLPFNVGLSAARNALVDRFLELSQPDCCRWSPAWFLLIEEDFLFTERTRIERFVDVLKHHPEVGCVGGSLVNDGSYQPYAVDFELFRNVLHGHGSRGYVRVTDSGVPYRLCDKIYNFGLFRPAMLADHRWDPAYKIGGEHTEYFARVARGQKTGPSRAGWRWRVAHCDSVRCDHDRSGRDVNYNAYRSQTKPYLRAMYRQLGILRFEQDKCLGNDAPHLERPNVLVYGMGHSGTTILTRMLFALGWSPADADERYAESVSLRALNRQLLDERGRADAATSCDQLSAALLQLPEPWAVKDPRFHRRQILERWLPAFATLDRPPLLLWIRREADATIGSYVRDGDHYADTPHGFRMAERWARHGFELWPWARIELRLEDLAAAAALFDVGRVFPAADDVMETYGTAAWRKSLYDNAI